MRANVLNDAALMKHAGRFAWLSVDTEKAQNEAFLEKFPVDNWPTFFVIDPSNERAALKWLGTANVEQLEKLFDDGELAVRTLGGKSPEELLALADRAHAEGRPADAAKLYREALQTAPQTWERRPRAVESLVIAFHGAHQPADCAQAALKAVPTLPRGSSFANAAAIGLQCALNAPKDAPWRRDSIAGLEPWVSSALTVPDLLADDRSGLYEVLVQSAESSGDKQRVKRIATEWLAFLEREASRAPTPEARAALDSHRVLAAFKLEDPARVIPALQASERDLPRDYNPPARLASVYLRLGRSDEGLAAADRALSRAYGPRRIGIFETKANIYLKAGDQSAAQRTLLEALQVAQALPNAQRRERTVARVQKSLDQLRGTGVSQAH
jgi:tetratricopeptide (TPR) repeat protein